jgi:hypothetical protein
VVLVGRGADASEANGALTRAGVSWEPASSDDARTAALALGTLAPDELASLRRALEDLETHLEARANPMVEDLGDGDPTAALALLVRRFLPALTACDAIASRRRAAPEGTFVVAVAARCDAATADGGVACVPLWKPAPPEAWVERARFLEWPLAAAIVLGFADAADARRASAALRARSRDAASRIALALDDDDLAGSHDAGVDEVRAVAARVLALAARDRSVDTRILELVAREPPPDARRIPWMRLDAEEVLVVPRLGALQAVAAFVREVEGETAALRTAVEWVHRPDPIR